MEYSDWDPWSGSDMYRAALANGATDLGGTLYHITGNGNRTPYVENNGQLGYYENKITSEYKNVGGYLELQSEIHSIFYSIGDGWHAPMSLPSGKDVLDAVAGGLSHPATSIALQLGDDALRALGLAKAIPGLNIAANAAGAYVYASDMGNYQLGSRRKTYRTVSNGLPLVLSVGAMVGAFGSGAGEAAVIIGAAGYAGEQLYDHVIQPGLWYVSGEVARIERWINSGNFYNSKFYSDQNLKSNIAPIENSLNKLLLINGYNFKWKGLIDQSKGQDIGLLAQELEEIYPELVELDSSGYKKVYYYKLIPVMVEAIKEQQKIIESQKVLLINYKRENQENGKLLESVLFRLEELEKSK